MNTSLGYGTMHQNCLRMIKLFCFIVVISNKFTTSLSYFLWSSAKWFFCTFDEGFPPDTSYYFFGSFVVETFFNEKPLKNRFYPFNQTQLKTILHKVKCFWFYINFDGLVAWKKPLFLEQGTVPPMRKLVHNHVPQKHGYKMNKSAKIIQVCKIKNKFEIINIQVCKRNKSANKNQGEFQISDQIQSKWPKSFLQEYLHHYTAQKYNFKLFWKTLQKIL